MPSLFDLAPGGVCRAATVTRSAVRFYRTVSTLPRRSKGGLFSVALSLGSPPPGIIRHRSSLEPGLSSGDCSHAVAQPSGSIALLVAHWSWQEQGKQFGAAFAVDDAIKIGRAKATLERANCGQGVGDIVTEAFEGEQEAAIRPVRVHQVLGGAGQCEPEPGQPFPWE